MITHGRIILVGFFCIYASQTWSASVAITTIADITTAIPSGSGNFNFFSPPSLQGGILAFRGGQQDSSSIVQNGIYAINVEIGGVLQKVVDFNSSILTAGGHVTGIGGCCSISGETIAFSAGSSTSVTGVYTVSIDSGVIGTVADSSTPIPGGVGNFATQIANHLPSIDGTEVAFAGVGTAPFQLGIYKNANGSTQVVADLNTIIPGGTNTFGNMGNAKIDGGEVIFQGGSGPPTNQYGLYTTVDGALRVVVDTTTVVPGGTGNFVGLDGSGIDGNVIAFVGANSTLLGQTEGIYIDSGGVLSMIVDQTTAIPEGSGTFTNFSPLINDISLDSGNIAFVGEGALGQMGIYLYSQGLLSKVIDTGDTLSTDKLVKFFLLNPDSLSGTSVAFSVVFTDGSSGVYLAQPPSLIPLPSTGLLLPSAIGLLGWLRRKAAAA